MPLANYSQGTIRKSRSLPSLEMSVLYLESHLEVMEQSDLLQWFLYSRKTGACNFSHGHKNRKLYIRDGRIIACESNEPHLLLGQFLISSGRIAPEVLRKSMMIQEHSGVSLGNILIEAGAISEEELTRLVVAKAEETVLGLAEWKSGVFRFVPDVMPSGTAMNVDLSIQHVLLEGARRIDEMDRALETLHSPHTILHKTDRPVDEPTVASFMGRRLYELIDGQRTTAELVLQCRTSQYVAYTFLARLVERGHVRVGEEQAIPNEPDNRDRPDLALTELQQLVVNDHFEAALDLIDRHNISRGHDDILSMLIVRAEAGYVSTVYRTKVPPDSVPHMIDQKSTDVIIRGDLSTDEIFLLELIDGEWDVRSLVWISPLRKVDVVRSLARLLDLGYIHLLSPTAKTSTSGDQPETQGTSVDEAVDEMFQERQPMEFG